MTSNNIVDTYSGWRGEIIIEVAQLWDNQLGISPINMHQYAMNNGTYLSKESWWSAASMLSSGAGWENEKSTEASPFDDVTPSACRISKFEGS